MNGKEIQRIRETQPYGSTIPVPAPPPATSTSPGARGIIVTRQHVARALARLLIKKPAEWIWSTDKGFAARMFLGLAGTGTYIGSAIAGATVLAGASAGVAILACGSLLAQAGMQAAEDCKRAVLREIVKMHAEDEGIELLMDGEPARCEGNPRCLCNACIALRAEQRQRL